MPSNTKNAFYAQSGGVTAVINATACGVIQTAKTYPQIDKVFAGRNGILGGLTESLIDTSLETPEDIAALLFTPGGAFGSCRYKLKSLKENRAEYERLIEVFKAHNIGYFFYNGGGDSQDTAYKVSQLSSELGYPLTCIGIPKTIDNDLPFTDTCPGFGSVAKYIATTVRETGLDLASMYSTSTKVFILEVMGRHAGWIAASGGLAKNLESDPPHLILFPEIPFEKERFCHAVKQCVEKVGYAVIVASEGIKTEQGEYLSASQSKDAFGHTQLGGVAPILADMITKTLHYKCHFAVADYMQRAARHLASQIDVEQAYALGKAAVELAIQGKNAVMPIIVREKNTPYSWHIGEVELAKVANQEKKLPPEFITQNGFGITAPCYEYLNPLIHGESYPPYKNGLPNYVTLKKIEVPKRLPEFSFKK